MFAVLFALNVYGWVCMNVFIYHMDILGMDIYIQIKNLQYAVFFVHTKSGKEQ